MQTSWKVFVGVGIIILCSLAIAINIYRLLLIDAKDRGLEKPKIWALIGAGGQHGEGLLLYFFHRRNHPKMMESQPEQTAFIRKKIQYLLVLDIIGFILFVAG
ncbi:hypothetical protein IW492_09145 [Enterococcus sp. BWB1-3]|nr:hypothetical protein [Enterococcus sp. BWB1-3]MBL1229395.1 hypothetical protein [Enterococcus sp. BWB1-3]MCB5956077.1 hypothetical protein [Enterococcus sp. CWB-B31]